MKLPIILFILFIFSIQLNAQGSYIPLGSDTYFILDRFDIKYGKQLPIGHTSVKPYSRKVTGSYAESGLLSELSFTRVERRQLEYLVIDNQEWVDSLHFKSKKPIFKVFYKDPANLYQVNVKDFILKINPVLDLHVGREKNNDDFKFINSRGLELRFYIKKKVSFYSYVADNQFRTASYVQDYIKEKEAVPGEGFYKEFRNNGVDFFSARGYINFNIIEYFDLQFGHDKNFIGNGYRSLLLSDYGNSYFFLKLNTRIWKINYQNIFAELTQQYDRGLDRLLDKKFAAFHHLNVSITPYLEIGLFEGVIFTRSKQFELQYLNPIIFYRSIEQDLGSPDNSIIGMDYKLNLFKRVSLYGQFLLDEFNFEQIKSGNGWWANKYGLQAGLKYIDVAEIDHLDLQLEYNTVRPYTYTHNSTANYTHYNQELAHPLGANFKEFITIIKYQPIHEFNIKLKYILANSGADSSGSNWGSNIFLSNIDPDTRVLAVEQEFGNETGQGVKTKTNLLELLVSYQPKHNLFFDAGITYRKYEHATTENLFYLTIGGRLNIPYRNFDF